MTVQTQPETRVVVTEQILRGTAHEVAIRVAVIALHLSLVATPLCLNIITGQPRLYAAGTQHELRVIVSESRVLVDETTSPYAWLYGDGQTILYGDGQEVTYGA